MHLTCKSKARSAATVSATPDHEGAPSEGRSNFLGRSNRGVCRGPFAVNRGYRDGFFILFSAAGGANLDLFWASLAVLVVKIVFLVISLV